MSSLKFREERATLVAESKKWLTQAESENLPEGEVNAEWSRRMSEVDRLEADANKAERKESIDRLEHDLTKPVARKVGHVPTDFNRRQPDAELRSKALKSWLMKPSGKGEFIERDAAAEAGIDLNNRTQTFDIAKRALSIGSNASLAAIDFGQGFDTALKAYGNVYGLVNKLQTQTGVSFTVPTLDDTANMAVIVGEAGAVPLTPDPTTGSVSIGAFKYSTRALQFSLELLQDAVVVNLDSMLSDMLAQRLARKLNKDITTGAGTSEPYGIMTRATASGTVIAGTAASPTYKADDFISLAYSVDPAYRLAPGAGFMMSDSLVQAVRKLKDSNGQYLWVPSLTAGIQTGQPDRLLGYPLYVNQDVAAMAVNAKVAAFGDYSRYMWREVASVQFYRVDELYILNGQIAVLGLYRGSGDLLNTAAIKTLAAPAS